MAGIIRDSGRGLVATIVIVALLSTVMVVGVNQLARATSGTGPYEVPIAVDVDPSPNVLETTIVADEVTVDIGNGVMANALTFNGTIPGPEIRVNPGDRIKVHLVNDLDEPTGIHWHGIELANPMDGTPITQNQVPPSGTFEYDFVAPRPGVYWYHPHHEFSTNQVFKGLYGSLVVTDPNEAPLIASGTLPSESQTLVLSDVTVCKTPDSDPDDGVDDSQNDTETYDMGQTWAWAGPGGVYPGQSRSSPKEICETAAVDGHGAAFAEGYQAGDIPNIQKSKSVVREGQTVLTNGVNVGHRAGSPEAPGALETGAQTLSVNPGQGLRLQVVNAAATRFFRLLLTDDGGSPIPLVRVGGEGGLLNEAVLDGTEAGGFDFKYSEGEILLDPGDRADLVAAIPVTASGTATLWTLDFPRQGGGDSQDGWPRLPSVPVAHLEVGGLPVVPAYTISDGTDLRLATGDPVDELGPPTGSLLDPSSFPTPQPGSTDPNITFTNIGGPGIDGHLHPHDFSVDYTDLPYTPTTRFALIGDTLELSVSNTTLAHHPFHLHGFSMQPKSMTCTEPAQSVTFVPEYLDEIDVPPSCTLTFRILLEDRPHADGSPGGGLGRWVIHCHIFFHHHQGMETELVVVAPQVDITAPPSGALYAVNTPVEVTAETVPGHVVPMFDWDDGTSSAGTGAAGVYTGTHAFTQAGVYTITASAEAGGLGSSDSTMVVVYDPDAGFVTGGGTIDSPAGAYVADPTAAGKANFGFVSRYKKGATRPDGQTQFKLHFAEFDFSSTAYDWLVVAGSRAQYKGTGTVNGTGNYGFLLTLVDGALNGGGGTDKFRIKIWDIDNSDEVVYDNVAGASDDIDEAAPQPLSSGSIVIHKGN